MKKITISLHDSTYSNILDQAISEIDKGALTGARITRRAAQVILRTIMDSFPCEVFSCDKCGKIFSVEGDEGSLREQGAFCNKHLPGETE